MECITCMTKQQLELRRLELRESLAARHDGVEYDLLRAIELERYFRRFR